jgi:hypothetical protein
MSGFKTFDDGTVVVPTAIDATSAWHVEPEVAKPAADAAHGGGKKKKVKPEGDGKAGIPGAVFNLANAVRGSERAGGAALAEVGRPPRDARAPPAQPPAARHVRPIRRPQIIGAGVGGMPYALKEAGFYR